jgi:hypothetical protein
MKVARTVCPGGKGAQTGNAEGLLTYRIKRATNPHRTGKLEDGGCAGQVEILLPTHFVFEYEIGGLAK